MLGILAYNAFVAANLLLVPVQPGVGAINGLDTLIEAAGELREEDNVSYRLFWTMFNVRTTRTNAIVEELLEDHQRHVLKSVVSKSESLNQANLAGIPITQYASTSRGAQEYHALCDELLTVKVR